MMSWDNIKKDDVVMYKIDDQEFRGIALDARLTEEGTFLFVVNIHKIDICLCNS